jgi:hypothetical protein
MKSMTAIRLVFGAIIVLILGGLVGWYFYLHAAAQSGDAAGDAADPIGSLSASAPSFGGTTGSTPANQAIANGAFSAGNVSSGTSSSELWEADATAVAGMGFVTTETDEYLYYVERGNGYVFAARPSDETTSRLTDTLMPKIYQALFADDGSVIERSIDGSGNVTTFLGTISTSTISSANSTTSIDALAQAIPGDTSTTSPASLAGYYLQPDIRSIALDPVTKELFYLMADPKGGVDGFTQAWSGTKKTQVFSSIVGSWRPYILADGTMAVLENPADGIPGYAYGVSSAGVLKPLVRDVAGLTILSKASSPLILYGSSSGSSLSLFGIASSSPISLPLSTVADKCVWLPGGSDIAYCAVPNGATPNDFLDNWYQGTTNTSDDWWEIDLSSGTTERIYSPSAENVSLDVEDPTIDPSGNYIAFENASDQSLWVLRVAQ